MSDVDIARCVDDIEQDLKAFVKFWQFGDHVLYRKVAKNIFDAAKWLLDEVEINE